jgi:hypothetical protein
VLLFADGQDANANYDWTFFTYFFLDEKAAGAVLSWVVKKLT